MRNYPRGCHACAIDRLEIIKIVHPINLHGVELRLGVGKSEVPIVVRPRGRVRWTVFNSFGQAIDSGSDIDVLRMKHSLLS